MSESPLLEGHWPAGGWEAANDADECVPGGDGNAGQCAGVPKQAVIGFLTGFSLETTPAIAAKVQSFSDLLPAGTSVYIAMLPGADHRDNVATAKRLRAEGMNPVPHIPARSVKNRAQLQDYLARAAGEAGCRSSACDRRGRQSSHRRVPLFNADS